MTLDGLKAHFTGLLNRRDLTANTSLVGTFIDQAILRVQRELRVPAMEKIASVTIADGYDGLAIPSDLLQLKEIRPQSSGVALRKDTLDRATFAATAAGNPQIYSRRGSKWVIGPAPSSGDVVDVTYYAELPALVNGTDENVISIIAWDLIVYAALSYAAEYYVDKRQADFESRYQQILTDLQEQADADALGDDAVVSNCLVYPPDDLIDCEVIT